MFGAVVVVIAMGNLKWRVLRSQPRNPRLVRLAMRLTLLLTAQLILGPWALFTGRPVLLTTAHVAVGALLLASECVFVVVVHRRQETVT